MKANDRGKGLCIELAINIFGVMLSYWVDYGMSYVSSDAQFRFPLALQIFFAIVTFLGVLFLPEVSSHSLLQVVSIADRTTVATWAHCARPNR